MSLKPPTNPANLEAELNEGGSLKPPTNGVTVASMAEVEITEVTEESPDEGGSLKPPTQ